MQFSVSARLLHLPPRSRRPSASPSLSVTWFPVPTRLRSTISALTPLAQQALDYLQSKDPALLRRMANSAAVAHILNHARNFDNPDVPKDPAAALLNALLSPRDKQTERGNICRQSLVYFAGPMLANPH